MSGETNLAKLLASMRPSIAPDVYVFATLPSATPIPASIAPLMTFRESEGTTLILTETQAKSAGLAAIFPSRMITLDVHSSLEAVGFIAAIATRLAAAGIGVNPVAGYFHDHLFVPIDRADEALEILAAISANALPPP
ncbi:MAG TPA: ACT domain-containing protein [Rhizobiaceae bacterium]|nr:ACT domain-containing protein [Rhizobiaceae bacterium]